MEIIKTINKKQNYITGIFEDIDSSMNYYNLIPDDIRSSFEIINITLQFPFYIIEEKNQFYFIDDIKKVLIKFKNIIPKYEHHTVYFNIYKVYEELNPNEVGKDIMGLLEHYHIDNSFLEEHDTKKIVKLLALK